MSTTQSHVQTGSQNFNFNPQQQRLTQMNARQDVGAMRQPVMPQMAASGGSVGAHFLPNGGQPSMSQLLQNTPGNPPMGVLGGGGGPRGSNPDLVQNQRLQQVQQHVHQRQLMQQAQAAQAINGTGVGASVPHMGRGGPNQIGTMGFPNNMMQQAGPQGNIPSVRRVQSQPQPLSQQGIHQGQAGGGGGGGMGGGGLMGMGGGNPQGGMPSHMRQTAQPGQGPQLPMQSLPPDMLAMRQGMPSGMQQPPSVGQRSTSAQAQLMQGFPQGPQPGMHAPMQANNYPPQQQHSQTTSPSPRPGQRSQPQTPANMNMPGPGQSQPNANRSQQDIFNFQRDGIFPPSNNRPNNSQFPFVPSTSPPHPQGGEMGGLSNPPGSVGNREPLFSTPAQQLQSGGDRSNSNQFNMLPPNIPQRPPSNQNQHPLLQQHLQLSQHPSPPQQDFLGHMQQRPQSQPQGQPGRPPSSQATPRTAQQPLPGHAGRMPSLSQPPGQSGGPQQPQGVPIAPRPPQPSVAGPPSVPAALSPPDSGPTAGQPGGVPRPSSNYPLGNGQGLTRLLQFSGVLASENKAVNKLSQDYWDALVKEYFAPNALFKFTLWKDNQRQEAKPFDINVPILPRFFLVTAQSGVKSMTLSLDGARERLQFTNHAVVECVTAAWTYKYTNGYTVTLRGPLTAHIIMVPNAPRPPGAPTPQQPYSLKFESLEFGASFHDKSISIESIIGIRSEPSPSRTPHTRNAQTPTANGITGPGDEDGKSEEPRVHYEQASIPGEPVNAFGIPQATMRCLELAESVANMEALIALAQAEGTGPIDSLELYANRVREQQTQAGVSAGFQNFPTLNGINANPSVTLYPPPANPGPTNTQSTPSAPPPQNAPGSVQNSPQKQNKTIPQSSSGSGSSAGPANASGSTPAMPNATLKRKQTDTASPVITDGPPAKRTTRGKRRGAGSS